MSHDVKAPIIKDPKKIKRALFSLFRKSGSVWDAYLALAKLLDTAGVEILASGGTATKLREQGVRVRDLDDFVREHAPEGQAAVPCDLFDGFVRTVGTPGFASAFARYDDPVHQAELKQAGSDYVDLFCFDPYPADHTESKIGDEFEAARAGNDTGGIAIPKAALKGGRWVVYPCSVGNFTACFTTSKGFNFEEANQAISAQAQRAIGDYEAARAKLLTSRAPAFDFSILAGD